MDPTDLKHAFFDMVMESQFWSPSQLQAYQRTQLEQLLGHARANVPFYESRLEPVFRADGTIDWSRWHELPLIRRPDMIVHRSAMQARKLPRGHGPTSVLTTSGSTGLPISVTVNALAIVANSALRWRMQVWQKLDWSKLLLSRLGTPEHMKVPEGEQLGIGDPAGMFAQPGHIGA